MRRYATCCVSIMAAVLGLAIFPGRAAACQARALTWYYDWTTSECRQGSNLSAEYFGGLWEDEMADHCSETTLDGTIYGSEITDAGACSWGDDGVDRNIDDGDMNLLVGHGANMTDRWQFLLTTDDGNGSSEATCRSTSTNMAWGNSDAEFVHVASCYSAQWSVIWDYYPYEAMHYRLHQFGGFHGIANTMNWIKLDDFADDAWTSADSVSWAWIENLQVWDAWGQGSLDLCPVNLIHGTDKSDASYRKDYEDYGSGYADTSSNPWTKFHFYCNCEPPGGPMLKCS